MKIYQYFLTIITMCVIMLLISCRECPPDKRVGHINLQDSSRTYYIHEPDSKLILEDSSGRSKTISAVGSVYQTGNDIEVGLGCSASWPNPSQHYYMTNEIINKTFESDDLVISIKITTKEIFNDISPYSPDTILYDVLELNGMLDSVSIPYLKIVTSFRGNYDRIMKESGPFIRRISADFVEDTTFLGVAYQNVFFSSYQDKSFLYSKAQGLLGFNDGTQIWLIKN